MHKHPARSLPPIVLYSPFATSNALLRLMSTVHASDESHQEELNSSRLSASAPDSSSSLVRDWRYYLNNDPRPFDLVSDNLKGLGALYVDSFLATNSDPLEQYYDSASVEYSSEALDKPVQLSDGDATEPDNSLASVTLLYETCYRVFHSVEALKFEFVENDAESKQCILTITRPDGSTKSFKTEPKFSRRKEARIEVARLAIEMGILDFIAHGYSDAEKAKKGILLASLQDVDAMDIDDHGNSSTLPELQDSEAILEIEKCCLEWRAGLIRPHWFSFTDQKQTSKFGCALRIMLTQHAFRVYSVESVYPTYREAKSACANIAVDEGVINYIKYGNGQTSPLKPEPFELEVADNTNTNTAPSRTSRKITPLSLQDFFESLPKPFPEAQGITLASEINGPGWVNTKLQGARGGRLKCTFIWFNDGGIGLHGCLLQLDRAGEMKSYLVDSRFTKRLDAKAAVCLLAMSQGIGAYIQSVKEEVENKLPADKRKIATEKYIPHINMECVKKQTGNRPEYTFETERDAYGCTLKVDVSKNPEEPDIRTYTVPNEYRTKGDAKAAVALMAVENGLLEILRDRPMAEGKLKQELADGAFGKRKELESELDSQGGNRNKRRKGNEIKKDSKSGPKHPLSKNIPPPLNLNGDSGGNSSASATGKLSWWRPHAAGFNGFVANSSSANAGGRPVVQNRHGNRNVGPPPGVSFYPDPYKVYNRNDYAYASRTSPRSPHSYPYPGAIYREPHSPYSPGYLHAPQSPPRVDHYGNLYPPHPASPTHSSSYTISPYHHYPPPPPQDSARGPYSPYYGNAVLVSMQPGGSASPYHSYPPPYSERYPHQYPQPYSYPRSPSDYHQHRSVYSPPPAPLPPSIPSPPGAGMHPASHREYYSTPPQPHYDEQRRYEHSRYERDPHPRKRYAPSSMVPEDREPDVVLDYGDEAENLRPERVINPLNRKERQATSGREGVSVREGSH